MASAFLGATVTIELFGVDPGDRAGFDYWHEVMRTAVVPLELRPVERGGPTALPGTMKHATVGDLAITMKEAPPVVVDRPGSLIKCSDPGLLKVELQLDGRSVVRQGEDELVATAGAVVLIDTGRPYQVRHSGLSPTARSLTILIAREVLAPPEASQWCRTFSRLPTGPSIAAVAMDLWRRLGADNDVTAERLSGVLLELLRIGLAGPRDPERPGAEDLLRWQVRRFIDRHLGDTELSPSMIAAAHHVSVRQLYRLLSDDESGIAALVRGRRLERCREDLSNSRLRDIPAAAISARWGFTSYPHFSRLFRNTYGVPPSTLRESS